MKSYAALFLAISLNGLAPDVVSINVFSLILDVDADAAIPPIWPRREITGAYCVQHGNTAWA